MKAVAVVLVLLSMAGASILPAQGTPEAAANAFGASIVAKDWAAAARFMHPEALRQLRGFIEPIVTSTEGAALGTQLFGIRSTAELAATSDTVLFARFLSNVMKESQVSDMLSKSTFKALGHIKQPGDTVLVVSRLTIPFPGASGAITSYELLPMLLYRGQYRGLLKADMTNLLTMMQARLRQRS